MEVITFRGALAARDDGAVVVAFFAGDPMRCVAIMRASREAAESLAKAVGSALKPEEK